MSDERTDQAKTIKENWKDYSPGDTVNLISSTWLKSWKSYVKYDDGSPVLSSKTPSANPVAKTASSNDSPPNSTTPTTSHLNDTTGVERKDTVSSSTSTSSSNHSSPNEIKTNAIDSTISPLSKSIHFDIPKPEAINNRDLVECKDSEGDYILKKNITEVDDYEIIPGNIWQLLNSWYPGETIEIKRKVIELGLKNEKYVEVRPILLRCRFHQSFLSEIQPNPSQPQQAQQNVPSSPTNSANNTPTTTTTQVNGISSNSSTSSTSSDGSNKSNKSSPISSPVSPSINSLMNCDFVAQKSRKSTLYEFREQLCQRYPSLDPNKVIIYNESIKPKLLKKYYLSLEDLKLSGDTQLRIHYQNSELNPNSKLSKISKKLTNLFKKDKKDKSSKDSSKESNSSSVGVNGIDSNSNSSSSNSSNHSHSNHNNTSSKEEKETSSNGKEMVIHKGVCGLHNLGNTCFMNSSIQCLAHTVPLVEYFLSNKYLDDINKTNPLGMKGQIAEIYGKLMKDMWSGSQVVTPKNLKWIIGKYAPQFSGLSQQDSQELLSFLLDGLHEDLNKILKKPYQEEKPESKEQRDDAVVANEQWENHLKRNLSIIVNLFQGQYKSTLICRKCSKISITFDPFMFVPLPIPVPTELVFDVVLYRCKNIEPIGPDPKGVYSLNQAMAPVRYCLKLGKIDQVENLRSTLSKMTGIESACIALAETAKNRIQNFLNDQKYLAHIRDRDLVTAYELPTAGDDVSRIHVMHRYKNDLLLLPYVLILKYSDVTCKDLYRMVWERVGHRVKSGWKSVLKQKLQQQQQNTPKSNSNNNTPVLSRTENQSYQTSDAESSNHEQNNNQTNHTTTATSNTTNTISSPEESSVYDEDDNSSIDDSFETIYPFVLKTTTGYGIQCDRCTSGCSGCPVEIDDKYVNSVYKTSKFWREGCNNMVIDWRPEIIKFVDFNDEPSSSFTIQDKSTALKTEMRNEITLNDCFSIFTKKEELGQNDTWYCPQCKTHIEGSTKKLELWSAPKILVINLKRFSYHSHRHEKINAYVDFPIDHLDISKWVLSKSGPPPIYQLYAVSNHMGGVGSGHYTACVKNRDQWYYISDSSYFTTDKSKIKSNEAYVLFYELKQSPQTTSTPTNPPPTTQTSTTNTSNNNSTEKEN